MVVFARRSEINTGQSREEVLNQIHQKGVCLEEGAFAYRYEFEVWE